MPITLVPYDPSWPERFAMEAARVRAALGDTARRIEHVGSTAVPGLAAKDIIDIQVSVASFEPESAYRGPLEQLGFVHRSDGDLEHRFFVLDTLDGRCRLVHIHVCETGSAWEARHLAFRDRLSRDADARGRYETLKRKLAPALECGNAYADAKGPFIRELLRELPSVVCRTSGWRINEMLSTDADEVLRIYAEGIATGNSTFEATVPNWSKWDECHLRTPRLVARGEQRLLGWAALSPVSSRCVYAGVAEVSIYVSADARKRGMGTALLVELIAASERQGIWTLQAGVFPENAASLALVQRGGFRQVGVHERIGKMSCGAKAGTWRDVILLERRSALVGVDGGLST
ncbi:GNAT family N-acetyltransferase [Myxococcota bacterium]